MPVSGKPNGHHVFIFIGDYFTLVFVRHCSFIFCDLDVFALLFDEGGVLESVLVDVAVRVEVVVAGVEQGIFVHRDVSRRHQSWCLCKRPSPALSILLRNFNEPSLEIFVLNFLVFFGLLDEVSLLLLVGGVDLH